MQFKLLNIHKFVGNFATSLVGTFIPLIIYNATGSLRLAVLFLFAQHVCRLISNHLFKNLYNKYPQTALIIRVIPLLIYNISLIFLKDFIVVGIIIVAISYGMNLSFKNNAYGVLLNYTSRKKTSRNLAVSRVFDALSAIVANVAGGLFIDWNQTALIIFSTSLYVLSVLPVFIYYLVNRKKTGFNKDFTSNAAIAYDMDPALKEKRKGMVKKFVIQYFLFYFIFCVIDPFTNIYTLHRFITMPTFAQAGYLTAIFQLGNLIPVLIIGKVAKKFDLKNVNTLFGLVCGIPLAIIPFIQSYIPIYILVFIFGFAYAVCSYFMMDSLMVKCKIISGNNEALMARQDGIIVGQMVAPIVVMIFNSTIPVFLVMPVALVVYSIYTHFVEEKLRKDLVNYLENNEIE